MRTAAIGLTLAALLASESARATPYIASSAPPPSPAPTPSLVEEEPALRRTEIQIGMLVGGTNIGDVGGPGVGMEMSVGRRWGDFSLLGQFDYLGVGEDMSLEDPRRGAMARVGLVGRYRIFETHDRDEPLNAGFWVEAGGGRQHVAWERGGTLGRNDLTLGFGMQIDASLGGRAKKSRYLGPYFAVRANVASAPASPDDTMPTCGGPCDTATTPLSSDVSVFFNFGLHLGR